MAETEGKEQECAASVYEYIENEYKEAWSKEKIEGGLAARLWGGCHKSLGTV